MSIETLLPIPDIFSAKRVLCIQPHYDDNDIAAAGTLALLREAGAELFYLTATDDLMGVIDDTLSDDEATTSLRQDQFAAAKIIGVTGQHWCGYPDAGAYDYFALRRDFIKYIRLIRPDFVFTADPWLTYEAHRDHIQTGLAAAEAVTLAGLKKIASSDPGVDATYVQHHIKGMAFYFTREPNHITDISAIWEKKVAALRCYQAQFDPAGMDQLVRALHAKSRQVAQEQPFELGEPLKILHPSALHCAI